MTVLITPQQLSELLPGNQYINEWCDALNGLLPEYEINTPARVAAFIAQCSHESGGFKFLSENLNYSAASLQRVFKKYFPTAAIANRYQRNPEAIANKVYGNRMGNGNEASGDGWKHRGRGLIQLTGKNNYQLFADSLSIPLDEAIEYAETFDGAVQSACWYWEMNNLNDFADAEDIHGMTVAINGGTNGLEDRIAKYREAMNVFNG